MADDLSDTRVEVRTGVLGAATIPWELLHDPLTDVPLALRAHSFVRVYSEAVQCVRQPEREEGEAIRILLVICRPGRDDDVPFRSVAMRLLEGLNEETSQTYQLDVLRPPTYAQLGRVLRQAKAERKPYHIVHFDGHGAYSDVGPGGLSGLLQGLGTLVLSALRTGTHGYLLFENPQVEENAELVDGPSLGSLLAETGVPVLVLNACRPAYAEGQEAPKAPPSVPPRKTHRGGLPFRWRGWGPPDIHTQGRAFGSLAQDAMDAGVAGVVAMSHNVYVVTAAQFVADLYAALARGQTLGQAVTMGRKQLKDEPLREIAFEPRPLQDWVVPVVYEAAPIALFPGRAAGALAITLGSGEGAPARGDLDPELPQRPDVGFYGRNDTLLALDRAFDRQQSVPIRLPPHPRCAKIGPIRVRHPRQVSSPFRVLRASVVSNSPQERGNPMFEEFKKFIMRGNVLDLSVGVVIGAAFGAVVKSFTDDILMPPIGLLLGSVDFANIFLVLKAGDPAGPYNTLAAAQEAGAVTMNFGLFINGIIAFLITALAIFLIVKAANRLQPEEEAPPPEPTTKACPYCYTEIPIPATRCPHCTSELEAA